MKGRRRVGNSRLVDEFGRRHPEMSFHRLTGLPPPELSKAAELQQAAGQVSQAFKIPRLKVEDWDELLGCLADQLADGHAMLVLDEINWLGRSDPLFSTRLWALWETKLSHIENFLLILCGSLAGWIDDTFTSNTGYLGRISLNMTLDELPIRDALKLWGTRRSRLSLQEQLQLLLVTAGVPGYLQHIDPRQSAEHNIKDLCFSSNGLLFLEYDPLLNDLFQQSNPIVREILAAVADAPLTLDELATALGIEASGVLSK